MLYNVLRRMIERGQTVGLRDKLDVFYAGDRLTQEQYEELADKLRSV